MTANVIHPGDVKTDMWADIRDRVAAMGPEAEAYRQWADWVDETGGDPPYKAVDLVLRLTQRRGRRHQRAVLLDRGAAPGADPVVGRARETQPWRK